MPNKTTNFKLIKPLQEEFYDVEVQNSNMDILDDLLKDLTDESAVKNLGFRGLLADLNGISGPDHIDKYPEGLSAMYTDRTDWSIFLNMTDFSPTTEFLFIETDKTIQDGKINATQEITRYKKESTSVPVKLISQHKRVWFSDGTYTGWSNAEKVVFQTEFATHLAEMVSDGEVHGMRVVDGGFEYFNGTEWTEIKSEGHKIGNVVNFSAKIGNKSVTLKFQDPSDIIVKDINSMDVIYAKWAGTKIVRKIGSYPVNENDGTLVVDSKVRDQYKVTGYKDTGLINGTMYYYMAFPYTTEDAYTIDPSNRLIATPLDLDDYSGSPGANKLIAGNMQSGYFGTVTAAQLITGDALAASLGISAGITQNSTTDWLKFAYQGKVQFIAKKPIRYNLTWANINAASAVFGTNRTIGGIIYKVRLIRGALTNPSAYTNSDRGAKGSEWNKLMLPIHENAPSSWSYPAYVDSPTEDWGVNFTDTDLVTHSSVGNGYDTLCQEEQGGNTNRVVRGRNGVEGSELWNPNNTYVGLGWRPVLEIVQ